MQLTLITLGSNVLILIHKNNKIHDYINNFDLDKKLNLTLFQSLNNILSRNNLNLANFNLISTNINCLTFAQQRIVATFINMHSKFYNSNIKIFDTFELFENRKIIVKTRKNKYIEIFNKKYNVINQDLQLDNVDFFKNYDLKLLSNIIKIKSRNIDQIIPDYENNYN